jgi:peptidoglycan/xylan/chitin deacetylase (PgdA/CDA1 family)
MLFLFIILVLVLLIGNYILKSKHPWVFAKGVPILMYHAIGNPPEGIPEEMKTWYVSKEKFKEQMNYLKRNGYQLLTLDKLEKASDYDKPIFITFDDGYESTMEAFEILENLKSKSFQPKATLFMITNAINKFNYLTAFQLKELSNSGVFSVQSHTAHHLDLTKPGINYEIEYKEANDKIANITGEIPYALAYPFGAYSNSSIIEAKKYYKYAFMIGNNRFLTKSDKDELYKIKRLTVSGYDSILKFMLMVR